ncbi:MAG: hypothetical protein AVDCRST_MAG59-873 [uncultured Thermomicrobiales bacterium]|uniref:Uncharacterized protein n=1 Tax=uncultured Thermomicrobiales bacterium TaxID=1645740 RepID=A0A6J4U5G3_9BACT|nr:MAG: hypothetical protein AVDCRST_MAG59-873 [uncultured Thermomicrobiales bacterium]
MCRGRAGAIIGPVPSSGQGSSPGFSPAAPGGARRPSAGGEAAGPANRDRVRRQRLGHDGLAPIAVDDPGRQPRHLAGRGALPN